VQTAQRHRRQLHTMTYTILIYILRCGADWLDTSVGGLQLCYAANQWLVDVVSELASPRRRAFSITNINHCVNAQRHVQSIELYRMPNADDYCIAYFKRGDYIRPVTRTIAYALYIRLPEL